MVMVTAALYCATGWLGLFFAIPPGYATAIWLPSGIALAAVLLRGPGMLPGIWLGSFVVNLSIGGNAWAEPNGLLAAACIGLSATLQAHVGARLIRRFVAFPLLLVKARDILLFLALGGGVGGMINASCSVPILVALGKMPLSGAPINWLTWWIGDAIGVFVMVPLALIAFGQPRDFWRRRVFTVGVPLVLSMVAAGASYLVAQRRDVENIHGSFVRNVEIMEVFAREDIAKNPADIPDSMRWAEAKGIAWWVDKEDGRGGLERVYGGSLRPDGASGRFGCARRTVIIADGANRWILNAELTGNYLTLDSFWQLWSLLVGSFLLTGMLGAFLLVLTGHTRVVEEQVSERTARLVELNAVLEEEIGRRQRAQEEARLLNQELEKRVQDRTAQLEASKVEAETANRAKSAFLANISHEVRTPMNGVLGVAEILERSELGYQQREWVKTLKASGETMVRLLDDVLDLAKVESGNLPLEKNPFALRHELDKAMRLLAVRAGQKGLVLHHAVDDAVPDALLGDALRLRQILLNLGGNAVKFTAHGSVSVRVELDGTPDAHSASQVALRFSVADTGVGIAPDQLPKLFQPFSQGDSTITRRFGGTGLGLSISAHLAQLMGGRVWAENRAGGGSVFHAVCVLEAAAPSPRTAASLPAAAAAVAPPAGRARRVLVVDDNAVNRAVAQALLSQRGHAVTLAEHGGEAVGILAGAEFDTILMDIQMPVMDGFEALRLLREEEAVTGRRTRRIIALTASAMRGDREICLSAGFNGYIGKPFQPSELFDMVELGVVGV